MNSVNMKSLIYILICCSVVQSASCQESRTVNLKAIGEDGEPIEDVSATVTYMGYTSDSIKLVKGETDEFGDFKARGVPELRIYVRLEKEGYYPTESNNLSKNKDHEVTYVLREVKNPIELYARKVVMHFPKDKQWIAFDFEFGDWIAPYGIGENSDVYFRCNSDSGLLNIRFAEEEGVMLVEDQFLVSSSLKFPHEAPPEGYIPQLARKSDSYHDNEYRGDIGYFFRTRIRENASGNMSFNYGKIVGNIRFDPRESGWHVSHDRGDKYFSTISFNYYFNPTPDDRNLEFKVGKNLFKNLSGDQQIREP